MSIRSISGSPVKRECQMFACLIPLLFPSRFQFEVYYFPLIHFPLCHFSADFFFFPRSSFPSLRQFPPIPLLMSFSMIHFPCVLISYGSSSNLGLVVVTAYRPPVSPPSNNQDNNGNTVGDQEPPRKPGRAQRYQLYR